MILSIVFLAAGSALLAYSADTLVKGSSALAYRLGVTRIVIGLTVVAFGTSAPELATSLIGGSTIAVGNVAGSNLMNIGLILGLTALFYPLPCKGNFLKFELPLMVALGPVFYLVCWNHSVNRLEGALLLVALAAFIVLAIYRGRISEAEVAEVYQSEIEENLPINKSIFYTILGIGGLLIGGKLLVDGAIDIAELLGVPERVIALTIVAGGTSLPELAASIAAARANKGDIALGNVIGSNIFNILAILGVASMVSPIELPGGSLEFDIPAVIVVQALCLPIMLTAFKIARWEGGLLLLSYFLYLGLLFYWQ